MFQLYLISLISIKPCANIFIHLILNDSFSPDEQLWTICDMLLAKKWKNTNNVNDQMV